MSKLDSLVVDLQVETASLRQGLDKAVEHLKGFGEQVKGIGESLHHLTELAAVEFGKELVESLAEFVISGAEAADKMGKLAAAAQVPVDTFQRLSYAAKLGGLSAEDLGASFNKLNKALGEAAMGSQKQVVLFQALGVHLKDSSGQARSSSDVFNELAKKLDEMAPGYAKATLEQELFGKSGTALDTTLHNVAEGMAAAGGEADKFGLVLSEGAIQAATEFHDNVERIEMAVQGVATRVAAELAPALASLTHDFLDSRDGANALKAAVDVLVFTIRAVISTVLLAVDAFRLMGQAQTLIAAALQALMTGDLGLAAAVDQGISAIGDELVSMKDQLKVVWSENAETFEGGAAAHKKMADSVLADIERMKNASKAMEERFKEAKQLADRLAKEHFTDVEAGVKNAKVSEAGVTQGEQFANIGRPAADVAKEATKGFADFQDALDQYTQAQIGINNEQAEAAKAKQNLDVEGYDFAMDALTNQEEVADRAKKAVGGFTELAQLQAQEMAETKRAIGTAILDLTERFGALGQVVSAAVKGFQSGGVWGALIAAVIELLSKFTRFKEVMDMGDTVVQDLLKSMTTGLSAVVDGLKSLLHGLDGFLQNIGSLLNGPLRGVAIMFDQLGKTLDQLSSGLGPGLDALGGIIDSVMQLIQVLDPMKPVITLLGALFGLVGIGLLGLDEIVQKFLSMLFDAVRSFVDMIARVFGHTKETDALELKLSQMAIGAAAAADAAEQKINAQWAKLGHQFDDAWGLDSLIAKKEPFDKSQVSDRLKDLGKSANTATTALQKLTEQFTNLPQFFKVRLRTSQAADPVDGGGFGAGEGRSPVHIHLNGVVAMTTDQLADAVHEALAKKQFRKKGY